MAKRSASVPLLTAMEWFTPQKAAKAFSNSSTTVPPTNSAVCRAWRNTPVSSCSSSMCGVTKSRKGMLLDMFVVALLGLFDVTQDLGRVAGYDGIGWNIFGNDAAGAYNRILANVGVR